MAKNPNEPERPRAEPEIIPPDRSRPGGRGPDWPPPPYGFAGGTQRIYVGRIGPFGFALIMLVAGLLAAILILILIGTALIWIPIAAGLFVIALIAGVIRRL